MWEKLESLMKPISKNHLLLALVLVICLGFYFNHQTGQEDPEEGWLEAELAFEEQVDAGDVQTDLEPAEKVESDSGPQKIYVDVKGAVEQPDMYEMVDSQRVKDAIEKAGGMTDHADQSKVNLAMALQDQMVIYIPSQGEEPPADLAMTMGPSPSGLVQENGSDGSTSPLVDINQADLAGLTQLNGIGEKKAQAIIDYREENGPFSTIEDIKQVSGIGDKSFESLRDSIIVSGS